MSASTQPAAEFAGASTRTVGEVMRPAPPTIGPDAHIASAAYLMKRAPYGALVVLTDEQPPRPVGLLTDADISQAVADGLALDDARIHQLRLRRAEPVEPSTPVTDAAERMLTGGLDHLPVVEDGRLVGLVDLAGVCRVLLEHAQRAGGAAEPAG